MSTDDSHPGAERWDRVFHALAAEPRRRTIAALREVPPDEWVQLPEAINERVDAPDERTARVRLHHVHLPVLAQRGYVEWETDPLRARRGPDFSEVAAVVESVLERTDGAPEQLDADRPHPGQRERS